jgi:chromate transporter
MSEDDAVLWTLAVNFAVLSFFGIGGANTLIPEMHRLAVDVYGWMTSERFTDLYAIAQGAPGPNIIVVTLIGWEAAGPAGAAIATLATIGPTSVLTFWVARVWKKFQRAKWRMAIEGGLAPVTIGLVAATAYVLASQADKNLVAFGITVATAITVYFSKVHPLLFLGAGAALGVAGLV